MKPIFAPKRPSHHAFAQRGRIRRALLFVLGAASLGVALYALAGFFGGPWLVDRWLAQYRSASPARTASRDSLRFNPFTLVVEIAGLDLENDETGAAFGADRLVVDFSVESLTERRLIVSAILAERPRIRVESVGQLAALGRSARSLGLERGRIDRVGLTDGTFVTGVDRPIEFTRFDLSLTELDADSGADGRLMVDAESAGGVAVTGEARLAADLSRADGELRLSGLVLDTIAERVGGAVGGVEPRGRVDLSAEFSAASLLAEPRLELESANLDVSGLSMAPAIGLTVAADRARATGSLVLAPTDAGLDLSGRVEIGQASLSVTDARVSPPQAFRLDEAAVLAARNAGTDELSLSLAGRLGGAGEATLTIRLPPATTGGPRVSMQAMRLPASMLSAYAFDAIGRRLTAGDIDLGIEYSLNGNRVDGSLRIVTRGLALAEQADDRARADTEHSLDLAAALLEDSDGIIEMQLPFASSAGTARDAAASALEARIAAVTDTPFGALAPIIGTTTASAVPFLPGDAALTDSALAAIRQLADALNARPRLGLRVLGGYDPTADRNALARQQIELHVQLATAGPADQARPAPVDFDSARARDVLDEFAGERLPAEQVAELRNRYTCEGALAEVCERAFYESIFDALVANEEITPTALNRLGRFRALSVIDALRQRGIADERLALATGSDVVDTPFGIGLPVELTAGSAE